jgi:hypothetical protein
MDKNKEKILEILDIPRTSCGVVTPFDTDNCEGLLGSGFEELRPRGERDFSVFDAEKLILTKYRAKL